MTTSIEHSMPSELVIADQSLFGVYRPGNVISNFDNGLRRSRSYAEHNLAAYMLQFDPKNYSEAAYEGLMALMNQTAVNAIPFWIKEPISKQRTMVAGEMTDGTRTTFINPLDITSPTISIGNTIDQAGVAYQHTSLNLLTDAQANAVGGVTTGMAATGSCTIGVTRNPVLDGLFAFIVDPTGSVGTVGIFTQVGYRPTITANREYTFQASILSTNAAHTYRIVGQFFDVSSVATGSALIDSQTAPAGEWIHFRITGTAPADAVTASVRADRSTVASDTFAVACMGLAPGDFGRWFLPSESPRGVEWASAPAADKRLTFSAASCGRWARVATDSERQLASLELLGNVTTERMSVREVLFT